LIDPLQLLDAYQTVRRNLLAERETAGHWVGQLSSSAFATAAAASALAIVSRHATDDARRDAYGQLARRAAEWLARGQNHDGGWGDTDRSFSNLATTMSARAAIALAGMTEPCKAQIDRAHGYITAQGGTAALRRRYGKDKPFLAPILVQYALAGLTPWCKVPVLRFELAALPLAMLGLRRPTLRYALPALVAAGQARFFHRGPWWNPPLWLLRRLSVGGSLKTLAHMQPPSGGFLETVPLTSFVVMSLAATGRVDHPIVRRGVAFLLASAREDGSWPIESNLTVWNTALATSALAAATGDVGALGGADWLLQAQQPQPHPFTYAAAGGWGWSDAAGAAPDADGTAAALLALKVLLDSGGGPHRQRIEAAAARGLDWLLDLQNADGGWPTFCRGCGVTPFDRSGCDLTAHAIRALYVWQLAAADRPKSDFLHWEGDGAVLVKRKRGPSPGPSAADSSGRCRDAIQRGLDYLAAHQSPDGSWISLWFGNQYFPHEENPIYGTSRVLLAYRELGLMESPPARRGVEWLLTHTDPGGGWGGGPHGDAQFGTAPLPSVEETAMAIEALLAAPESPAVATVLAEAIPWLVRAIREGRHREATPIGLYLAKLWYHEKLYPLTFSVAALGQAIRYFPLAAQSP
jgi:squalene-hopene/tetraprenyl-beta-curcumene cyclase